MQKVFIIVLVLMSHISLVKSQNVGIGQSSPVSKLDVNGNLVVGSAYSGVTTAPTDGAIIEGSVGIGTNNPGSNKLQVSGGSILFDGDFVNQALVGSVTSVGSSDVDDANATLVNVPNI